MNCLFGNTGCIGRNISNQSYLNIDLSINTSNNHMFRGEFDNIFFCGARAVKYLANKNPNDDKQHIDELIKLLKLIKCSRMYLISTIDVYDKNFQSQDELGELFTEETYGKNRRILEKYCLDNFNCKIFRLPAIFGDFLKKNIIYDIINNKDISVFNKNSFFQWYNLDSIFKDIYEKEYDLNIVNLFSEPVSCEELLISINKENLLKEMKGSIIEYNYKSVYGLREKSNIIKEIKLYYEKNSMFNNN